MGKGEGRTPRGARRKVTAAHFRLVADATYDWESWHGPDGRLIWVNPAVERITGYSVQECHAFEDYPVPLVAPEDRSKVMRILAGAKRGGSGNDAEFRVLERNGNMRWVAISWQPILDRDGQNMGFRTSVRDITERQRLRDELRRRADSLEQLVEQRTARLRRVEQQSRQMERLAALGRLAGSSRTRSTTRSPGCVTPSS